MTRLKMHDGKVISKQVIIGGTSDIVGVANCVGGFTNYTCTGDVPVSRILPQDFESRNRNRMGECGWGKREAARARDRMIVILQAETSLGAGKIRDLMRIIDPSKELQQQDQRAINSRSSQAATTRRTYNHLLCFLVFSGFSASCS